MTPSRTVWKLRRTADGSWTLLNVALGQCCHSIDGAWREARERYAQPTRIGERARSGELRECRLLDVGTGLGLNLAAALEALHGTRVGLVAHSLELDPEVIERGLECMGRASDLPASLERWYAPVGEALARALHASRTTAQSGVPLARDGRLHLRIGDARRALPAIDPALRFDAVFLDPFSPSVDPPLWEAPFLAAIAARMAPGSLLSTYSASFLVRVRLAAAGLRLGVGPRVGRKSEGTLASPDLRLPRLPARTARRLERAQNPLPDVSPPPSMA